MKVHKKKFNKEMQNNFNNRFGKMTLIGERYSYPMITIYAKKSPHQLNGAGISLGGQRPFFTSSC